MATYIEEHYERIYKENLRRMKICPSCLESFTDLIYLGNCQHGFCEPCIKNYLRSKVDDGSRRIEDFGCMVEDCDKTISEVELERWMDFDYFNKLTNKVIYELHFLCPNCRQRGEFSSNDELVCPNCCTVFCKFCKAQDHEGKCNTSTIYFKEVRAAIEDEEVGYCPDCKSPFMKDENCDHVTCQNPECELEFCFYCWVPFNSINWHGGMYHRTDCRNYESYDDNVDYYDECPECQKMKDNHGEEKVCERPIKSRTEFLDEILTIKQY